MTTLVLALLIGLELKHFMADYLLQPGWMLADKASLRRPGGDAHAGLHAALTLIVLLLCATPLWLAALVSVVEFALHYGLDYAKVSYSAGADAERTPQRYWALHGIDQFAHQLTYAAVIFVVLRVRGLA